MIICLSNSIEFNEKAKLDSIFPAMNLGLGQRKKHSLWFEAFVI